MSRRPFLFSWKVAAHGHEWIDGPLVAGDAIADTPTRVLVGKQPGRNIEYRYYEPLRQETALFRQFARLPVDEDAIAQFADRYGLLTGQDQVVTAKGYVPAGFLKKYGRRVTVRQGDSREAILDQVLHLKTCVTLWEKVLAGDKPFLRSVITFLPNDAQLMDDTDLGDLGLLQDMGQWGSALVRFSETGVLVPAQEYFPHLGRIRLAGRYGGKYVPLGEPSSGRLLKTVEMEPPASFYVGERSGFRVTPKPWEGQVIRGFGVTFPVHGIDYRNPIALAQTLVTTEIMQNVREGLSLVIQPQGKAGWGDLRFVPKHLSEAMWLQLAEAVCGNKNYRQCQACGKPFELSPDVARTSRLFCSDSCKMQSYRQRKAQAGDLWDQNYSVREIADSLHTSEANVRKWVVQHLVGRRLSRREIGKRLGISEKEVVKLTTKKKKGSKR